MIANLTKHERKAWDSLHSDRQTYLNELRWSLLLQTGIPIAGQTIFEAGAGIGDQTEWLLNQGAKHVIVNDGRGPNLDIIRKRFGDDPRVSFKLGNLEDCLGTPEFKFTADLIYLWGVYYHINDCLTTFPILKGLSSIAPVVVLDYLESSTGKDYVEQYGYDNPSTSLSQSSGRPTRETMLNGLRKTFGHAYLPKVQMEWHDCCAPKTPRKLAVGSRTKLDYPGLIES